MIEPQSLVPEPVTPDDGVAFQGPVRIQSSPSRFVRGGIVLGSALLFVAGAVAAMGASPTPSSGAGSGASPNASGDSGTIVDGDGDLHMGRFGGFGGVRDGIFGRGGVTITAITGSNLSLKTDDGWTRTIAATGTTTITRAGATIAIGDLKVGDTIGFRQERATDGTYTITAIDVVLPSIAGQVTAVDGSTITVKRFDGTTGTIHVTGATTYEVDGVTGAKLSDVKVDAFIVASGTARDDGSLDAEAVHAGVRDDGHGWFGGRGGPGMPGMPGSPDASPAPSTTPG